MLSKRPTLSQPPNPEKTGPVNMGCSRCEDVIQAAWATPEVLPGPNPSRLRPPTRLTVDAAAVPTRDGCIRPSTNAGKMRRGIVGRDDPG